MAQKAAVLEDENAALKARSSDADARIQRLLQILKAYDRARFGRRSEKLGTSGPPMDEDTQQAFVFEEIETGIAALKHRSARAGHRIRSGHPGPARSCRLIWSGSSW